MRFLYVGLWEEKHSQCGYEGQLLDLEYNAFEVNYCDIHIFNIKVYCVKPRI